ncbi:MAG: Asp-tRNA(Asn)/Glu-tRNA(Gln) amidotransferase subunit GatC [Oscillospiraceae bacterium]|nr:Asp-tRNA(Asn)/Glu-tRNA(Gln) amidotransferase subunit GatC [Oscillospiraceae bacterium]
MNITPYEAMAKLSLPDDQRERLAAQMRRLADSFAALEAADTENVEPLVTVLPLRNVLREDEARQIVSRETLLRGAPEQYDGYFQVPKTIE